MSEKSQLNISALSPDELAKLLSKISNRSIREERIFEVAQAGGLCSENGKINLLEFTAWLASEVVHGTTD